MIDINLPVASQFVSLLLERLVGRVPEPFRANPRPSAKKLFNGPVMHLVRLVVAIVQIADLPCRARQR
jgi:hypothetical protein